MPGIAPGGEPRRIRFFHVLGVTAAGRSSSGYEPHLRRNDCRRSSRRSLARPSQVAKATARGSSQKVAVIPSRNLGRHWGVRESQVHPHGGGRRGERTLSDRVTLVGVAGKLGRARFG
jgi:hypothetical protein